MTPPYVRTSLRLNAPPAPFIKWAGGKGQLLHALVSRLPVSFGTYIEPFIGGGALFFAVSPPRSILCDLNGELMEAYTAVRDNPEALIQELDCLAISKAEFLRIRSSAPETAISRAARFVYLNKTCYNGLYRVNKAGRFNVPFGKWTKPPRLYDRATIEADSAALRDAELLCGDFEIATQRAKPGDFVYFDPPYIPTSATAHFTSYTRGGFGMEEQQRLAREYRRLDRIGVAALLSNSETPATRELYAGFRLTAVPATRAINSKANRRGAITELLVTNY